MGNSDGLDGIFNSIRESYERLSPERKQRMFENTKRLQEAPWYDDPEEESLVMGNCKDCKWWEVDDGLYPNWGTCQLTATNYAPLPVHKDTLAFCVDDFDSPNALQCSPDFGCVQWYPTNEFIKSEKERLFNEMQQQMDKLLRYWKDSKDPRDRTEEIEAMRKEAGLPPLTPEIIKNWTEN